MRDWLADLGTIVNEATVVDFLIEWDLLPSSLPHTSELKISSSQAILWQC